MLEACEDVIHSLWEHSITIEYHESVASFLLQCVSFLCLFVSTFSSRLN